MGRIFTIACLLLFNFVTAKAQILDNRHNPEIDFNLNPTHNNSIHPDHNSTINPKLNWNINPLKNGLINPEKVPGINPKTNAAVNPLENEEMSPMFSLSLSPKNDHWHGMYVFDTNSNLVGYLSKYSQELMFQFDKDAKWNYFYVRTAKGTYNQFNLSGDWTGSFLCFDSMIGYNIFDKNCSWTGMYIK